MHINATMIFRLMTVLTVLVLARNGASADGALSMDPVEAALADVREANSDFFEMESSVLGKVAGPADYAVAEPGIQPGPRGELPVAIDFTAEQAADLARRYKHRTFLEPARRWMDVITLGITGIRARDMADSMEFPVVSVDEGTPAAGRIQAGDIIIGANGCLFREGEDPRILLGFALGESETEALGGVLTLQLVRDGAPMNVPVEIGVLGAWGPRWPYDSEKARIVGDRAVRFLLEYQWPNAAASSKYVDGSYWNPLLLMASGAPEALENVRREMYGLASFRSEFPVRNAGKASWSFSYWLVALCEYYLLTGDSHVLPGITHLTDMIERGQSEAGSWGHNLPCDGYGELNQVGSTCFLALALARECGVTMDPVALPRAIRFFGKFAGGTIPYGDHPIEFRGADNGRNCQAGLAFHILGEEKPAARFTRYICYSYRVREFGHAASAFSFGWGPSGANLAGPEFHVFMNNLSWYYDLMRTPEGAIQWQRGRWSPLTGGTGIMALGFMLPRKNIRVCGAPQGVFGTPPPPALRKAAELYKAKQWAALTAFLDDYLKQPGAAHAGYAKDLLAAYERLEKQADDTMDLIRHDLENGHAKVALARLNALKTLLGEERPEMAKIRAYFETPDVQAAINDKTKPTPLKTLAHPQQSPKINFTPETPIVWDNLLPSAAGNNTPHTFESDHAAYRYMKVRTTSGGEVYLNGCLLATLPKGRSRGGPREIMLGPASARAVHQGRNILTAHLDDTTADISLSVGPRPPDMTRLNEGLNFYCTFDEANSRNVSPVLPAGLQASASGSSSMTGRLGPALRLGDKTVSFNGYHAPLDAGGSLPELTVSFWSSIVPKYHSGLALNAGSKDPLSGWRMDIGFDTWTFTAANGQSKATLTVPYLNKIPAQANGWNHYAAIFDGSARLMRLYRNGEKLGEHPIGDYFTIQMRETRPLGEDSADALALIDDLMAETDTSQKKKATTGIVPDSNPLLISGGGIPIDELAIWNRALTEEEVLTLCNGGNGLPLR